MSHEHDHDHRMEPRQQPPTNRSFWLTLPGLLAVVIFAIIAFYIIAEHRAHIGGFFAAFPWLLLILLCPLMHLMHGGHHHHRKKDSEKNSPEKRD